MSRSSSRIVFWTTAAAGLAAAGYLAAVSRAWVRYGRPAPSPPEAPEPLLDAVMPVCDVAERHEIRVAAPADAVLRAACEADVQGSRLVRAIFAAREAVLGATGGRRRPEGLLTEMQALGWRVVGEEPGSAIALGAVTQPWRADVTFRGMDAEAFAAFDEPEYVRIAWTLRVEPLGPGLTRLRTETRAVATDAAAARRFRWYWARFSPGIVLIRSALLRQVKAAAERSRP